MTDALWYAAKCGRVGRARVYLDRAGVECFSPEKHHYFRDKRSCQEKCRVGALMPGYIFIRASTASEIARADHSLGVSYVLGSWVGDSFIPRPMPAGWVERLISTGPVIEGKRKKFCAGQEVRVLVGALSEIVGKVVRESKCKVTVRAVMFGTDHDMVVSKNSVETVA